MTTEQSSPIMGVVIYISDDRERAILWCEDHGPLAYVRHDPLLQAEGLGLGDCVTFRPETRGDFRTGSRLERIGLPTVPSLPGLLRSVGLNLSEQESRPCATDAHADNIVYPTFGQRRRAS